MLGLFLFASIVLSPNKIGDICWLYSFFFFLIIKACSLEGYHHLLPRVPSLQNFIYLIFFYSLFLLGGSWVIKVLKIQMLLYDDLFSSSVD